MQDDEGFAADLGALIGRRAALAGLAGLALAGAAGAAECPVPAEETAGPFPGDGSNSVGGRVINVLGQDGVQRVNLRASFAGLKGSAEGLPLHLEITLQGAGCTPLAGAAIYVWHCDAGGRYSIYDLPEVNYLRGLGVADARGVVRFDTVFPGCYPGRWPHLHFEVFVSAEAAVAGEAALLTSQFALPEPVCSSVYATTAGYEASKANFAGQTLTGDMVFRDNTQVEMKAMMLTVKRDPMAGASASAVVAVSL